MVVTVLPLRAILFQILFLLIAIAVESFILQRRLNLSRRNSIEYAASINLFSTILSWCVFFFIVPLLPDSLLNQLINFILFGDFALPMGFTETQMYLLKIRAYFDLSLFVFLIFLLTVSAESIGLDFCMKLNEINVSELQEKIRSRFVTSKTTIKRKFAVGKLERRKSNSILMANAWSQGIVLIICILIHRL